MTLLRVVIVSALVLGAAPAQAQERAPSEPIAAPSTRPQRAIGSDDEHEAHGRRAERERADRERVHRAPRRRRPLPDYGSAPERADPVDALLWIPRVIFFPLHLVFEYGVRAPLAWLVRALELEGLDAPFTRGMTQMLERPPLYRFSPIFRVDYGMLPAVGLGVQVHDVTRRYQLGADFAFWGPELVRGSLIGSARVDDTRFVLEALGSRRDDAIFHGLGWSSPSWPRARYTHALGVADLYLTSRFWRASSFSAGARVGIHRFSTSDFRQDRDLSIAEANAATGLMPPPGYPDGYTAAEPWARVVVDSRPSDPRSHATGARGELYGSWAVDVERGIDASWARVGGSFEVAMEVLKDRSLHVRGMAELVEPLGGSPVPFTEQVWLGGEMGRMPGFLRGRLIGLSATSVGVSWRYGLGAWFDAEVFVDVGNVFAARFEDFEVGRLRLSAGAALMAHRGRDFTLLFAFGTEPFEFGATVSSARVLVTVGAAP